MVFVITGGPGFGKTTVINHLAEKGYLVGIEGARKLLDISAGSNWPEGPAKLPVDFEKEIASERLSFLNSVDPNSIAFADRGLPDQIAYSWYKDKIPSTFIEDLVSVNRYAPVVFVTPPWEAIFIQDEIRRETFAQAKAIHDLILKVYLKYGYEIVDLPLQNPELRVNFIQDFLGI